MEISKSIKEYFHHVFHLNWPWALYGWRLNWWNCIIFILCFTIIYLILIKLDIVSSWMTCVPNMCVILAKYFHFWFRKRSFISQRQDLHVLHVKNNLWYLTNFLHKLQFITTWEYLKFINKKKNCFTQKLWKKNNDTEKWLLHKLYLCQGVYRLGEESSDDFHLIQ